MAAAQLEPPSEQVEVYIVSERERRWPHTCPDAAAIDLIREWEVDDEGQAAHQSFVEVGPQVRGENDNALVLFHPLEQVRNLHIGVAIMGVTDFRALAKERVGLVEE